MMLKADYFLDQNTHNQHVTSRIKSFVMSSHNISNGTFLLFKTESDKVDFAILK